MTEHDVADAGPPARSQNDRFERLVGALREPVVVASSVRDADGAIVDFRYEFLNAPAAAIVQRDPAELVGTRMTESMPHLRSTAQLDVYRAVVDSGEAIELRLPTSDGASARTWEVSVTKLADGFVAVGRDVTDRTADHERLRQRERLYRILADYASEVAGLSVRGVIVWVSSSITDLLGWSVEDFVGRPIASFVHPDDRERMLEFRHELDAGSRRRIRCRMAHRDGSWRWIETSSRKTSGDEDGFDDAAVSMLWDVHAEVEAVEALQRAHVERAELESRVHQAERLESLGVLAGGVAHDFNNVLMGVRGNAELAIQRTADPATRGLLEQIVVASQRAAELTRQMLDYAGKRTFESHDVEPAIVIDETMQLVQSTISRSATVSIDVAAGLPSVVADPSQLRQVLMNLLLNASDAVDNVPGGSIVLRATTRDVDAADGVRISPAAALVPGTYVVIEVSDDGGGMGSDTVQRMFEPFFSTKSTGKGLGLSVVHGVIRSLGGAVEVDSSPGVGTSVRVLIPAGATTSGQAAADPPPASDDRILVVDDDSLVLDVVSEVLTSFGHVVARFSAPRDAVAAFTAEPSGFALALIDVTMPEMSGPEVLAALRSIRPELPAVIMSGYSQSDVHVDAGGSHTGFLQKPFGLDMLLDATTAALAAARTDRS